MEIKDIIAPNLDKQKKMRDTFRDVSYYLIIGLISIIVMAVVPILTGCLYGDISIAFPDTLEGWILWTIIKLGTSGTSVAIFVLFKQQAKVNVKDDPKYKAANEKLFENVYKTEWVPRSPKAMNTKEYARKGSTVFITTLLASITISSLIISFDLITFISACISAIISIVFGWTTMLKNEIYWTEEYPLWVDYITKEKVHD